MQSRHGILHWTEQNRIVKSEVEILLRYLFQLKSYLRYNKLQNSTAHWMWNFDKRSLKNASKNDKM